LSLKEFKNTKQDSSGLTKRWFSDVNMDVMTWSDAKSEEIKRIEVSFEEDGSKRLWTWSLGEEGSFYQVDEGDLDPRKNMSQIAHDNYEGDFIKLLATVENNSGDLPQSILSVFRMLA
tara:strand:+ start:888 stop:1241 length:354 start_codon:yes stop_codon:yes gene_type:complete